MAPPPSAPPQIASSSARKRKEPGNTEQAGNPSTSSLSSASPTPTEGQRKKKRRKTPAGEKSPLAATPAAPEDPFLAEDPDAYLSPDSTDRKALENLKPPSRRKADVNKGNDDKGEGSSKAVGKQRATSKSSAKSSRKSMFDDSDRDTSSSDASTVQLNKDDDEMVDSEAKASLNESKGFVLDIDDDDDADEGDFIIPELVSLKSADRSQTIAQRKLAALALDNWVTGKDITCPPHFWDDHTRPLQKLADKARLNQLTQKNYLMVCILGHTWDPDLTSTLGEAIQWILRDSSVVIEPHSTESSAWLAVQLKDAAQVTQVLEQKAIAHKRSRIVFFFRPARRSPQKVRLLVVQGATEELQQKVLEAIPITLKQQVGVDAEIVEFARRKPNNRQTVVYNDLKVVVKIPSSAEATKFAGLQNMSLPVKRDNNGISYLRMFHGPVCGLCKSEDHVAEDCWWDTPECSETLGFKPRKGARKPGGGRKDPAA